MNRRATHLQYQVLSVKNSSNVQAIITAIYHKQKVK